MKRFFKFDKKYLYWGITAFCVVAGAIVFYMLFNYLPAVGNGIKSLFKVFTPFIWGLVITYLLSPVMHALDDKVFLPLAKKLHIGKKTGGKSFSRAMAVLFSIILLLIIIAALIYLIIPQLYTSLETMVRNFDTYITNFSAWVERVLARFPDIESQIISVINKITGYVNSWLQTDLLPQLGNIMGGLTSGVYVAVKAIYNLVIGIIVSIYLLRNVEGYAAGAKRILYSIFSTEKAHKFLDGLKFTNKTFMGFISGKLLDSLIIGVICYIVCAILNMPYALLVSTIVGVTNVIPFFGPFIGAIPSALVILLVDPMKCLIFIILIVVLQQLDGNVIGPKILGNSIGINGFWVMFSIIIGSGLFGFWGMLLGAPVFAVIYTLLNGLIERRLKKENLPSEIDDYVDLDYIDPITREKVPKPPKPERESKSKEKKEKKSKNNKEDN